MTRLLAIGDFGVDTGFGRVNERLLAQLDPEEWDVAVIGVNNYGQPHPLQKRYRIYPASATGDVFGYDQVAPVAAKERPDLFLAHNDAPNVGEYLRAFRSVCPTTPAIAYCPPDSPNQPHGARLSLATHLLCPTQFGVDALTKGGYTGPASVLSYGIDRSYLAPVPARRDARVALLDGREPPFPHWVDGFVVGRADRNARRKRHDLTLQYWRDFLEAAGWPEDAYLHLHCAVRDATVGWDLPQLVDYYGLTKSVYFTGNLNLFDMPAEARLQAHYRTWDLHWSTTMGEGFGLVALESAACGAAQLLPDWSAYGEIWKGAATLVPCTATAATAQNINTIGGIADRDATVRALMDAYNDREGLWVAGRMARLRAQASRFDWSVIGAEFRLLCQQVLAGAAKETV